MIQKTLNFTLVWLLYNSKEYDVIQLVKLFNFLEIDDELFISKLLRVTLTEVNATVQSYKLNYEK